MKERYIKAGLRLAAAFFVIFIFLAGCQGYLSCQDPIGCISLQPGQPLTIGIERATTGDESAISQSIIDVVKFAASQQPLFYRHPVQFYIQDTPCTLHDHDLTTGLMVSQPDMAVVIGPVCQQGSDVYAKAVSDAGFSLLSPARVIDSANYPGVFNFFPSTQVLVEGLDALLLKMAGIQNISLVVWNEADDIDFSTQFCAAWQKHGYLCSQVLSLQPDKVALSDIKSQLNDRSSSLIFILPFSYLGQIPDLDSVLDSQEILFFDPALSTWDKTQDPIWKNRLVVTYHWPTVKDSVHFPSTILPEIRSLIAYDIYQMLIQALTESIESAPGGKITILRQKLRQSIGKIVDFNGLAGLYSCTTGNMCMQKEGFLELRMPNP